MGSTVLDLTAARRWAVASRSLLSESREKIDRLNVFPVPDGDTGTNMFLTVDGALAELRVPPEATAKPGHPDARLGQAAHSEAEPLRLSDGLARLAHGMLLSARGNSGVILSQLARGMSEAVQAADPEAESMSATVLTDAFARASHVAWAGVSRPIEGTILSVARAAAHGAKERLGELVEPASPDPDDTYEVARAALHAARQALARTPEQLPSLARAGVVDAGGAGFVLVLEALEGVLGNRPHDGTPRSTGEWDHVAARSVPEGAESADSPGDVAWLAGCEHLGDGEEGAQEVMYLLRCGAEGADQVRERLTELGSSVMVVGGPQLWRVHVHLDHTAAALDAGSQVGEVQQVSITSLQAPRSGSVSATPAALPLAVVCCAPGPGLGRLFAAAGAHVVHSAAGNRASTGALLAAARETGAPVVAVLPNDGDTVLAARAAAEEGIRQGLDLRVVPTVAAVQGLAALSLWDAARMESLDSMLDEMTEVAHDMAYGALVPATESAQTAVGPCRPGQWLGLVQGRIISVTDDLFAAAAEVLTQLVRVVPGGGEALTLVAGADCEPSGLDSAVNTWINSGPHREPGDLEIRRLWGGQLTYPWLLGLE